ncbi:MAG TPA: hypothetical protein V6C97_35705 [Oculatellaceae cyanobacterium]
MGDKIEHTTAKANEHTSSFDPVGLLKEGYQKCASAFQHAFPDAESKALATGGLLVAPISPVLGTALLVGAEAHAHNQALAKIEALGAGAAAGAKALTEEAFKTYFTPVMHVPDFKHSAKTVGEAALVGSAAAAAGAGVAGLAGKAAEAAAKAVEKKH